MGKEKFRARKLNVIVIMNVIKMAQLAEEKESKSRNKEEAAWKQQKTKQWSLATNKYRKQVF